MISKKKRTVKALYRIVAIALFAAVLGGSVWAVGLTDRRVRTDDGTKTDVPPASEIVSTSSAAETPSVSASETPAKAFMETTFKDSAAIFAYLESHGAVYDYSTEEKGEYATSDSGSASSTAASAPTAGATEEAVASDSAAANGMGGGYSQTNTQESNVDEADVIKTDGSYIYYLNSSAGVAIVRANGAETVRTAIIKPNEDENWNDLYIYGDKLVTVGSRWVNLSNDGDMWWRGTSYTVFTVYNIADRSNPTLERKAEVEGNQVTTRMKDGIIYYVTNKNVYSVPKNYVESDIVPTFYDTLAGKDMQYVSANAIGYIPESDDMSYLIVGGIDLANPAPITPNACLGSGSTVYMSGEGNLYVSRYDYSGDTTVSAISKFSTAGISVWFAGEGRLDGDIINQYAMDEFNSNLRVASTTYSWQNGQNENTSAMYVFDAGMNRIGYIGGIAPGEQIYSVRFMDETAYVVTFETMDPLFVLDLSVPTAPVIKGQLKIPGFSQYLHPFGKDYLIGIGRATTETYIKNDQGEEEVVGYRDMGLKLSLFDVSDVMNPLEIASTKLGGRDTYSDASYDPKSIMADISESYSAETGEDVNGVLAFPVYFDENTGNYDDNWNGGVVVSVNPGKGFGILTKIENSESDYWYGGSSRFCFIGNTLYYIDGVSVTAVDYTTYERLGRTVIFSESDFPVYDDYDSVMPIAETAVAVME